MRLILTILFLQGVIFGQSKCIEPVVSGNFTPIITLPVNEWTFGMTAQGMNGSPIVSYLYSITSGTGILVNASSSACYIENLIQGITTVRLIVADSCGSKDTSNIIITVNPVVTTGTFEVSAMANPNVLQLPENSSVINLHGNFPMTQWIQESGSLPVTYSNQADSICTISGLVAGSYTIGYSCTETATNPSQTVTGIVIITVNSEYILSLIPNPAYTSVVATVIGPNSENGTITVNLYNIAGTKILQQKKGLLVNGKCSITFSLNYKNGTYPMNVVFNGVTVAINKLVIQK